jgi:uncharacterized phage protein (TIGR01671 family)
LSGRRAKNSAPGRGGEEGVETEREIKFRAYAKSLKMVFPVKLIDFVNSVVYVERRSVFAEYIFTLDEVELMQFTGLRDKNGKEVCEGDIVNGYYFDEHKRGQVVFDEGAFSIVIRRDFIPCLYEFNHLSVEGNIYEHPHLLGGESTCT